MTNVQVDWQTRCEQAERERDEARETIHREHVRPTIDEAMYRTNELLTAERRKAERAEASCAAKDQRIKELEAQIAARNIVSRSKTISAEEVERKP